MGASSMSLTEAAAHLGVHYMTAYRYVRTGRLDATKVDGEWQVDAAAVAALMAERRDRPRPSTSGPDRAGRRRVEYGRRIEPRLIAGDEAGAWSVVDGALAAGLTPSEIHLQVLSPALARIGERWAAGDLSIAEEHRATAVTMRIIGRLGPRFSRPGRTKGTVVIGGPSGDQHALPSAMVADLLRGEGYSVIDLGPNSPPDSFVDAARSAERLVAVGVSATTSDNDAAIAAVVDAVHTGVGCPVLVGGGAVAHHPRADAAFGADAVTTDVQEMFAVLDRLRTRPSGDPTS